ncbi:cytadherence high molecular weight protein 2-like [Nothobranchius furzeri]|uniref:Cytadherence high molecular weight protein 2-like n=1 Tax=Nothobranchius furzeri TaxID=105023 RepID=A0A9D2YGG8_NOTFU|nr:cytadherence high molecular weight protein 2-like [Nothobranchius furzeri]
MTTQFSTTHGVHLDQHKTLGFVAFLKDGDKMRESHLSDIQKQTRYFKQKFEKEQTGRSETREKIQRHFDRIKAGMDFPRASSQDKKTQANVTTTDSRPDHFKKEFEMEKGKCLKSNNDIQKRIECLTDENKALCTQLAEQQTIFKEKETQLQKALEDMKFSHQELTKTYNTDVLNSKITANNLENELKKERHAHQVTKTQLEHISSETDKKFKQNETRLQKDLDCMKELRDKFESDLLSAKQQIKTFEDKLHLEVQAQIQTKEMNDKLRAEKDDLQLRFNKEMSLLQENFDKKETELKNALEKVKVLYQELNKKYKEDVLTSKRTTEQLEIELKKERHDHQLTKTQLEHISSETDKKFEHKETRLQKELDCMKVSNQQLRDKSEDDLLSAKQQIKTFEEKLHLEIQAHSETKIQTKEMTEKLRAEKDALQMRADRQMSLLQENFYKKETELKNTLEKVGVLYQELNKKYKEDVLTIKHAAEQEIELKKERLAHQQTETQLEDFSSKNTKRFVELEQFFKGKEALLQKDLDDVKVSNQQLRDTSEADLLSAKQQLEYFEDKLNLEIQAHSETKIQTKEIIEKLRTEKVTLQIWADRQISLLQENFDKKRD